MTTPTQDLEHLKLLSIFHYVVAALAALFGLYPTAPSVLWHRHGDRLGDFRRLLNPMTGFMGWFFIAFSSVFILSGWAFAVCLLLGRPISLATAALHLLSRHGRFGVMFMPFGTVLGVFTIIVLLRDSVKELFGVTSHRKPRPSPGFCYPPTKIVAVNLVGIERGTTSPVYR